jgi:hypothetical protein
MGYRKLNSANLFDLGSIQTDYMSAASKLEFNRARVVCHRQLECLDLKASKVSDLFSIFVFFQKGLHFSLNKSG